MGIQQRWLYIAATILAGLSFIFCALVCSAILWSPKTRTIDFNLYLVALILPDVIVNLTDFIIRCIGLSEDKTMVMISFFGCVFNSCINTYYILTNIWTSALICSEVHQLLVKSNNAKRFIQSEPRKVLKRASILNVSLILFVLVIYVMMPQFGINIGKATCLHVWHKRTFLFLIVFSCFTLKLPIIYICYITIDVYRNKLLPTTDQSRFIATFFIRTAILTTIFTLVVTLLIIIGGEETNNVFDFTKSGQGLIIAGFSMMKPDIRRSVLHFVSCGVVRMSEQRDSGTIYMSSNILKEPQPGLSDSKFLTLEAIEESINNPRIDHGKPRTIENKTKSTQTKQEVQSIEV